MDLAVAVGLDQRGEVQAWMRGARKQAREIRLRNSQVICDITLRFAGRRVPFRKAAHAT